MPTPYEYIEKGDAVLVVDVQKCFCPGGELPVGNCDSVVRILNEWIEAAILKGVPVYFTRDWHPRNHISFENFGGQWPLHCIQDTDGARFHPGLKRPGNAVVVTKGVRFDQDQYSAFDQTGLAVQLRKDGIRRIWIGGLALDVCVYESVMDALKEGFEVRLLREASCPVDVKNGLKALKEMEAAGAQIV
jgi:nicotinamidase/pyrazinamidase